MKKIFTLIGAALLAFVMLAAPPTVPSSNLQFTSNEGSRLTLRFTAGNGASRIIVMKAGSPVTGQPVNGTDYIANAAFGTAAAAFTAADEYVVYKGTSTTVTVTNLLPNTVYHIAIYEMNGTGVNTEYLMIPLTGSKSTAITPETQASNLSFSQLAGSTVRLSFTAGSGDGRLVVARKGSPVDAQPANLQTYASDTDFGEGADLGNGNFVLFAGNGTAVIVNSLEANSTYYFAVFERNGNSYPVYKTPGATASVTTSNGPTVATQSIVFTTIEGNRLSISMSKGNGSRRILIARKGAAVTAMPVNGQSYTANAAFGAGAEIAPNEFVVLNSTGTSVTVTDLEPNTTYHFRAVEFDQNADGSTYYLNVPRNNSGSTATTPLPPSNVYFDNVTGSSLTLRFNAGTGSYRFVLGRESEPVNAQPANLLRYTGSGAFGSGTHFGNGNYALNSGSNGSAINVTNLQPGRTYHFAVFEYSGNNYPVYSATATTVQITMPAEPLQPSTNMTSNFREGNSFRVLWTNGDGSRRIVIGRKNTAVTALPVDGVQYTANDVFGNGTAILPDQFVVYDGSNNNVQVSNLEPGTTYHFTVFEYNLSGTSPDYLTSAFLAGTVATHSVPLAQPSSIAASNVQTGSATIGFTPGDGEGELWVMKKGSPVDADPLDLIYYGTNSIFGLAELSNGNYLISKTTTNTAFNVSGLEPGTTYYVKGYSANGSAAPVYLRPGAGFSFTTAGVAPTTKPTVAASAPSISNREGNSVRFSWVAGNGSRRVVIAREGAAVDAQPQDGQSYTASAAWQSGQDLGNGQFVIYDGEQNAVNLTGLNPASTYHFAVFEYNGTGTSTAYLTASFLAGNGATVAAPQNSATDGQATVTGTSAELQWQKGDGQARLLIVREGAPVTASPTNLTIYPANASFGNGSQVGLGEYVVYANTGSQVTITGLTDQKTYYYRLIEYNGSAAPVYSTQYLEGQFSVGSPLPVTWLYFRAHSEPGQIRLDWATVIEDQNHQFVIERAQGQGTYEAIDSIPGAGNSSSVQQYSYTDRANLEGHIRYRLRQVDIDGRFRYSQELLVQLSNSSTAIRLYPNPARDLVKIDGLKPGEKCTVSVYDMRGQRLLQQSLQAAQTVNISHLPSGQYLIRVLRGDKVETIKLIKQ